MTSWNNLIAQVRQERRVAVSGRFFRKQHADEKTRRLYEAYIEALGMLIAEFELYSAKYTPEKYAEVNWIKLCKPPRWTDFVSEEDKDAFRLRQQQLLNGRAPKKELFPEVDRAPRGTLKLERMRKRRAELRKQLHEEEYNNAGRLRYEPSSFADFRALQIPVAWEYLAKLDANPMANVPRNWLELLPPADRPSPHDDVVRSIYFNPAPVPPPPPQKPRGRPAGTKDSKPRIRKKMTEAERMKYRSKREALRSYREMCAIKYGE